MRKAQQEAILLALAGIGLIVAHKRGIINLNDLVNSLKGIVGSSPTPPPPAGGGGGSPAPSGTVLYDSNNGWTNYREAASGSPQFTDNGDGTGTLSVDAGSHGRIYIDVPNYNAVMQGEFMFNEGFNDRDNLSLRLRSRHGDCGGSGNVFGGFGSSIHINGEVGFETEICHNEHENSIDLTPISPAPQMGQWYGFRYYAVDSADKSSVNFKFEFDDGTGFKTIGTGSHNSPAPEYLDEPTFMEESSVWLRINNETEPASITFRNFKVIAQEAGSLDGEVTSAGRAQAVSRFASENEYIYGQKVAW
jgi:hypothetical protein